MECLTGVKAENGECDSRIVQHASGPGSRAEDFWKSLVICFASGLTLLVGIAIGIACTRWTTPTQRHCRETVEGPREVVPGSRP